MMENKKLEKFSILCYFHQRGTLSDCSICAKLLMKLQFLILKSPPIKTDLIALSLEFGARTLMVLLFLWLVNDL